MEAGWGGGGVVTITLYETVMKLFRANIAPFCASGLFALNVVRESNVCNLGSVAVKVTQPAEYSGQMSQNIQNWKNNRNTTSQAN